MKYEVLKQDDFIISDWSGGTTTQIAIYPKHALYSDREFIFRLSSATVDMEHSEFTWLPDYDRWLMVLEGGTELVYDKNSKVSLAEYEYDAFDGGVYTESYGKITDYNLMLHKGSKGFMRAIKLESIMNRIEINPISEHDCGFAGIYIKDGYAEVLLNDESIDIETGNQLVIYFDKTESITLKAKGRGTVVFTQGMFNI